MDETQLVFVGRESESNAAEIGVLDFGRIQPFFQNELKSEILWARIDFKVHNYTPQEAAMIEANPPFPLCALRRTEWLVNEPRKWYNFCDWPSALSACPWLATVFLMGFLFIKYKNH